jgi:5-methylcytosine-specific restriction endonuclease McrA
MDAWKRQHPLCVGCGVVGRIVATAVCDHIVPHKGDKTLLWSADNWQPACREHHDVVKQRLEDLFARGIASASDLRLDSARAITLTRELLA